MDRNATATWLAWMYKDLLGMTEIPAEDSEAGFKAVLDQVSAIYVDRPSLPALYANDLASWFLLHQFESIFMAVPRITVDSDTYDFSKVLDGIRNRLAYLRGRIGWIVEPIEDGSSDVGKVVSIFHPYTGGGLEGGDGWSS